MNKNILSPEEVEALLKKPETKGFPDLTDLDENLKLHIELGQIDLSMRKFINLEKGDEISLDATANSELNIFVNGRVVAKGKLKIVHHKLTVSLTDILHKYS